MNAQINIAGQVYGRLTALYRVGTKMYPSGGRLSIWRCKCECGNEVELPLCALKTGNTKSCGCLHTERIKMLNYRHGKSHSRLNEVWKQMKRRCYDKKTNSYQYYGAKGVTVCREWSESFEKFEEWMLANGYDENAERGKCTIDRIDPFGNYEPQNCRIVGMDDQYKNLRRHQNANND